MKNVHKIFLFFPLLLLCGCSPDSPLSVAFSPPKCEIMGVQASYGSMYSTLTVTVQNTGGGATAFNIVCVAKLKSGSFVVETESGAVGTLEAGESTNCDITFFNVHSASDYQSSDITLYWQDSQGTNYQN